jgi:hypoxanthine phosphoribosyltransferase
MTRINCHPKPVKKAIMKKPDVLFSADHIAKRVAELGAEISAQYVNKPIVAVGILKGCFVFMADLIRKIQCNMHIEFIEASSYGNELQSSGIVSVRTSDLSFVKNKHILIVEDIIDTGLTLKTLTEHIKKENPASLQIVSLLVKKNSVPPDLTVDYTGFNIEDDFVVGYGLDAGGYYRNLDYIGILDKGSVPSATHRLP